MAVSFKVPKSPKRDIFEIDTFMGVDLTNTGSNIDEIRSPNAPNMVRYVPGKVRKRTGFKTNVLFSDGKDVNRAKNTSDEWITLYPDDFDDMGGRCIVSQFYSALDPSYLRVDIEAVGSYRITFELTEDMYTYWDGSSFSGTEENPYTTPRWWYPFEDHKATSVGFRRESNNENDYIKFKCLKVCGDTAAASGQEFCDMPWTPAPEDSGNHFCKTDKSSPVYGCHLLRNGNFDGNRVVNVNRALGTSKEFETFNITTSNIEMYNLAEAIFRTPESYRLVDAYLDLDYILDGDDVVVQVAGNGYGYDAALKDTGGTERHYSSRIPTGSYTDLRVKAHVAAGGSSATLQVKNLSVCYQKDDKYRWSPAPEDNDGIFHTEDIYNIGRENVAIINNYSREKVNQSTSELNWIQIADADHHIDGFAKLSFDIHTDSSADPSQIIIAAINDHNQWLVRDIPTANVDKKHYEWYVSAAASDYYIKYITVEPYFSTTGITYSYDISNIELNTISPKEYYAISSKNYIYHVGSDFWLRPSNESGFKKIYSSANKRLSRSWQLNDNLYIIDGQNIYTYAIGDENAIPLTEIGKIPVVTIAKSPAGGGTPYEALNMLQPGFEEWFGVTESEKTATQFHLSFGQLDHKETQAWVMDSNANWVAKKEGTDYTVDRGSGTITFTTAPGKTPLTGEDNVKIRAYRTVEGYADRVNKCTVGALFGVGGAGDRLFLSGNPDYPNWDFYSEQFDPTYFPDLGYSVMGSAASAIVGYAIINNYLAAFKDEYDESQSVFIREGDLVVNKDTGVSEPAFKLINTLQGNGVVAPYSFGYLTTEPLFLTRSGIYAITVQDITGEKYSQNRSFYLDGQLTKEDKLENAVAVVYKDQYVLAINGSLYILDGLQPTRTDKSMPYSTRQYAGFYCTDVPAICLWTDDQALWFGTNDGRACRFETDIESLESYNDDGAPIYCCWETPDLDGKLFYKNKTFRYFAVRMMSAIKTSVSMWSQRLGEWTFIKETTAISKIFDFNDIDFSLFTFRSDSSEKVAHSKVRVKKVDKARFRLENGKLNEPFGLFDLALEYIESGNYKR